MQKRTGVELRTLPAPVVIARKLPSARLAKACARTAGGRFDAFIAISACLKASLKGAAGRPVAGSSLNVADPGNEVSPDRNLLSHNVTLPFALTEIISAPCVVTLLP